MEISPTPRASGKAERFTESVIREMTRLCMEVGGINLAQGFPDFPAPEQVKEAAIAAVRADVNQYAVTWGAPSLREALAAKMERDYDLAVESETEITVTCGSTEAMISTLLATVDPGDEVVVFEPFYENYGPDAVLAGAVPRYVTLRPPDWTFDEKELESAFGPRTRALILNSPNNPTGKVFTREELEAIASLCRRWNVLVVTDEIYEHIVYDGSRHVPMATLPGMRERTVTISALSKTFSVTGWRVGWAVAPPEITAAVRKVHDFLTVGAPAPLQEAGSAALRLGPEYYAALARDYRRRRDVLLEALDAAGFRCNRPQGAYYVMADLDAFDHEGDVPFARRLVREAGVAVVPGSSFYHDPSLGRNQVRFCFCKTLETLRRAGARLRRPDR
jgi:aspartate/methionine/tyrosine aminotransferase